MKQPPCDRSYPSVFFPWECLIALDPPPTPLKRGAFRLNMMYTKHLYYEVCGIQAMSCEESHYWFAKISNGKRSQALKAIRVLLGD